jgi:type IV pilus assembly protein PilC
MSDSVSPNTPDKSPKRPGSQLRSTQTPHQETSAKTSRTLGNDAGIAKLWQRMGLSQAEKFCDQMNTAVKAGVDITKVIQTQAKAGSQKHQDAMKGMLPLIQNGNSIAKSMAAQDNYFPPLLTQMVHAGESSGQLEHVFNYMAEYYRDLKKSRTQFIGAIIWPVAQLGLALLVVSGLIYLSSFFGSPMPDGQPFDPVGLGIRGASGFFIFWAGAIFIIGGLCVIAIGVWQNWFGAHQKLFPLLKRVPVVGTMLVTIALSRMAMALSLMLGAGQEARRSVRTAFRASGNHYYMQGLPVALAEVEKGSLLSKCFAAPGTLPREFIESLEVGEMSGNETDSLERLATQYQDRARRSLLAFSMIASGGVWAMIAIIIIVFIFRIFFWYLDILYSNMP